jgi:lysophospholipase L1-like esterase
MQNTGKRPPALLITVFFAFILAAVTASWAGYKEISAQLASVKAEVASLKSEVVTRKGFIPPLFGARHLIMRKRFVLDQISQTDRDFSLVVGDSIVEGMYLPELSKLPTINAGMGGGGVLDALELISAVPTGSAVKGVLIAIGVNDAARGPTAPDYFGQWSNTLRETISRAKTLAGNKVAVTTVIPVEKGKTLGDQYFDPAKVGDINILIRNLCSETKTQLIDHGASFAEITRSGAEYTTDGVHLNSLGYMLMKENIQSAVAW